MRKPSDKKVDWIASVRVTILACICCLLLGLGISAVSAQEPSPEPPPGPSKDSVKDQVITNPLTNKPTTVANLLTDPEGTHTAGETAFVQTADGYTFLVKSAGEKFYNSDKPPVAFTIVSISGDEAFVSSPASDGTAGFHVGQKTESFDADFSSEGTDGIQKMPVKVSGPNGVKQVVFGQNGRNGRNGALFVPPRSGGDGQNGPEQTVTLSSDVKATSNIGWEVGSVGGDGGKGGNSYASFFDGRDGGDGGAGGTVNATQAASSTIVTEGDDHYGIFAYSRSGKAGDGGSGFAAPGGGTGGHSSDGGSVTVTQQGKISTSGQNSHGIYALSVSNNGGNGGDQWGLVGKAGNGGFGGSGGSVVVNTESGATILTSGAFSNGILAQSIGGSGGSAGSSGNLLVSLIGSADNGGNGGAVTVSNGGAIETHGTGSSGIFAQSIGGGGGQGGTAGGLVALALGGVGSNGGSGGTVAVTNTGTGSVLTLGDSADGIMAQSIGGSGGDGANAFGLVSIGGTGSKGGSGSAVSVTNQGVIETRGKDSVGIIAQSIGGGGGDGGSTGGMVAVGGSGAGGGDGGVVTVTNDGAIKTTQADSQGILAQSVGGGGGNGGSSGAVGTFVSVAVGGGGGAGGQGGDVNLVLSDEDASQPSQIVTKGDRSTAVFGQSVGGGGGNGGGAVSVAAGFSGAAAVSVGGQGGDGGDGGVVTLTGIGDVVIQTGGEDATGILLQSVGGGGGNGGYSISAAASAGLASGALAVGVGGSGGSGGEGGTVTVGTVDGLGNLVAPGISGSVRTAKDRSAGMIFQSIGGGGGNGGLAVAASAAVSPIVSANLSVSVGGSGGDGGDGGEVKAYTDADITTLGNSSTGLLVESIGGGGGNGGGSIAGGVSAAGGGSASINLGVGGSGGTASKGGAVTLIAGGDNIYTEGQFSNGVIAQSIGGGGGNGGYAIGAGGAAAGGAAGAINVAVGGSAGGGGAGGSVDATVRADVTTKGLDSDAVLIQSIGGGGGNGGYSVAAGAAGAGAAAGTVTVSLGGSGGDGGEGGAVRAMVEGEVYTKSDRSAGVVAQSIGGGGGNGGFNVSGSVAGAGLGGGSVSVGLGGSGGSGGNGGSVNAEVKKRVTTDGNDSTAVLAQSVGGGGGNGGFDVAAAVSGGGTGSGAVTVGLGGDGGSGGEGGAVTLVSNGNIQTGGERSSGFVAQSIGGGGGNGGFNVSGSVASAGTGAGSVGVGLGGSGDGGGNGNTVNATSNGTILTQSYGSSAFVAQSIGGGGGNGAFNVSAGVALAGTGSGSVSVGLGGSGAGGGDGVAVTAKTTGNIETKAGASTGILAQSVGGGGGNGAFNIAPAIAGAGTGSGAVSVGLGGSGAGGGNGGTVDLTVENDVWTHGKDSAAIIAQSIGGGGGNGSFNVTVSGTGAGTGSGTIGVGLGGRGGTGGRGGAVTSTVTGNVTTEGDNSSGLLVQSLGGGGGNGGMNVSAAVAVAGTGSAGASVGLGGAGGGGGVGGTASGTLTGNIKTSGNQSSAFVVQSLGGGGGNGGLNVAATITAAGTGSGGVSVGIGGSGGGGGDADTATGELTGDVVTLGMDSTGFLVQSLGGGGGNGGLSVAGGISASRSGAGSLGVGVGGFGGDGGNGAAAKGTVTGNVQTREDRSGAVVIQSLGGGGGNGGTNVTGTVSLASQNSGAIGVGIGGFGGGGGNGGTATGTVNGNITTEGDDATGVLVQSLGGGGGNGGLNVTGELGIAGKGSGAAAIGIGGFGGSGGQASDVVASYNGSASTKGVRSNGVVAQSLGGGGGNGGINVSAGLTVAGERSGSLGLGIGGFGGGGGKAGSVDHTVAGYVETDGNDSIGILTQSLGGGGGNGGLTVDGAVSISRQTSAAVALGVGGFGGTASNAGALTLSDIAAGVLTRGKNATGILTQSLGGAGGNGGTTISGALDLSQKQGGSASLGVGGFGGGGGNGGKVESKVRTSSIYDYITTLGDDSTAVMAQSIGGGGGNGGLNVSGSASLTGQDGAAVALGVGGFGGSGGNGGDVSLDVAGKINTYGDGSTGILAQSLGGGGGTGGTNVSGTLSLTKPSGSDTVFSVSAGVGGFGGGGGNAGNVDVNFSGLLTALPRTINPDNSVTLDLTGAADGLVAQSIGGGGGTGGVNVGAGVSISSKPGAGQTDSSKSYAVVVGVGGFGGTGGNAGTVNVDVADDSTIVAHGVGRSGILAQSVGGGGGNGGMNVSGGLVSDTSLIVGVGGLGGNSGTGGDVTVLADADISVTTDPSYIKEPSDETFAGKLRDFLGGTVVDGIEELADDKFLKRLFVSIGLFESDKTLPDTEGSAGVLAQSIGGAGGNGGLNVSGGVAISKDEKIPSVTFGVGGFGGAGNISGDVSVDQSGTIAVEGNWKHGILAQSIAGGGGNGSLNLTGQMNYGSSNSSGGATDLSVVAGIGGHGGVGADAGDVNVVSSGDITTSGYHARGILAQSIGGGGGTGGMNILAVGTKDSTPVGIGIGGTGAAGGDAGNVSITRGSSVKKGGRVVTNGLGSHGIEASSIGGGGGDAGINAVLGVAKTSGSGTGSSSKEPVNNGVNPSVTTDISSQISNAATRTGAGAGSSSVNSAVIAVGGSAGNAGNGGEASITNFGDVFTHDNGSYGVFAQSIGGGGGNASYNQAQIEEANEGAVGRGFAMVIGGGTGDGGSGGKVSITNSGIVGTRGDDSHGIFAQSVGGGGGNAGYNELSNAGTKGQIDINIGRTGGTGGAAGDVSIVSDSQIVTEGARSNGVFAQSIGNGGGTSSSTSVSLTTSTSDDRSANAMSVNIGLEGGAGGAAGKVEVETAGSIGTTGDDSHGIFAQSVGGGGGTGGGVMGEAGKATTYSFGIGGKGGSGSTGGAVTVKNSADIATKGDRSIGILAQSVGGGGGTGGYANAGVANSDILDKLDGLSNAEEIGTANSVNIGGSGGDGMASGNVVIDNTGIVTTSGDYAHGILATAIGGGGGLSGVVENNLFRLRSTISSSTTLSVGGDGGSGAVSGSVTVGNAGDIGTQGYQAAGIFAQSVGGGGGDAQHVRNIVVGRGSAEGTLRNALLIGGSGGSGASAGTVTVRNEADARIITNGKEAHGIFAQSVGGGGGNGGGVVSVIADFSSSANASRQNIELGIGGSGGDGGTGGTVSVVNNGLILTRGDKAHGILAQSIGGGGGNGGQSISGADSLSAGTKSSPAMALNIGGSGGTGNAAGTVNVTNTGTIDVSGSRSYGILAQSVGGGGGNGGMAVALSVKNLAKAITGSSFSKIAVGGSGGSGADGADVTVNNTGTIIVRGDNSYGILAQSVGGGGGNAGFSISTPAVMAADYVISNVLGARTGTNGVAGTVDVRSSGDIIVTGAGSQAILSQSINGGGGNVDAFLDFSGAGVAVDPATGTVADASASLTSTMSLGGEDLDDVEGADVQQRHDGDVVTTGNRSSGVVTQTIGGGGGTSTMTVNPGERANMTVTAMLGAINTNNSAGGDIVFERSGAISTAGALSSASFFQSIGGGGGRLVIVGGDGAEGTGARDASVVLGADPSFNNPGGDITLTLSGDVSTLGDNSNAQIVQSIGAGGGESYLTGLDKATITLGATDGSTGDGGAITVTNVGGTSTAGQRSNGFVLQSIGGGGGLTGTDLDAADVNLVLSDFNGGDGGSISFTNTGHVITSGDESIAILAQSLGGGGGSVDSLFHGSAGGAGSGRDVAIDQTGNVLSAGARGIAVLAQSLGKDGAGSIDLDLDGVIVGGSDAGGSTDTAAIVIGGGTNNTLSLSSQSFLTSVNNRILLGGSGSEAVTLNGKAVGNVDLGGGLNTMLVSEGASFWAQDEVDLGASGTLTVNGNLYLGGASYLSGTTLGANTLASDFGVTGNVLQTTAVNGSLIFGDTAVLTADVNFGDEAASDLIQVSGDVVLDGTIQPVLNGLSRTQPLALITSEGSVANNGVTIIGTPVVGYQMKVVDLPGGLSGFELVADANFRMPGMNRNQTLTADHINRVLAGQGSAAMGDMFGLIANMATPEEVRSAVDDLSSYAYAVTQIDALYSGYRFAQTLADCGPSNFSAKLGNERGCSWTSVSAGRMNGSASYEYQNYQTEDAGFSTGINVPLNDNELYLGAGAGFESFSIISGDNFSAGGNRGMAGASLSQYIGDWKTYGIVSGSISHYNSNRYIDIAGTLPNGNVVLGGMAQTDQTVAQANFRIGTAYRFDDFAGGGYFEPGLHFDAAFLHSAASSETGTPYGLDLQDTNQWIFSATPSLEVGFEAPVSDTVQMQAFLRGAVSFADKDSVYVNSTFAGARAADGVFSNYSQMGKVTGKVNAGVTFTGSETGAQVTIGYQGMWSDDTVSNAATVDLGFRF